MGHNVFAATPDARALVEALRTPGATALPLLSDAAREKLARAARMLDYAAQPESVGPPERRVHQRLASHQLDTGREPFAALARALEALLAEVHASLPHSPWRSAPTFNDFLAQHYPPGSSAITPHLDGKRFVDLVAIVVLAGEGRFCLCDDRAGNGMTEIPAPPGSVIFMRAPGFDGAEDGRPFHCLPDITVERYTLGLRHSSRASSGKRSPPSGP